jgi:hypothetical protein
VGALGSERTRAANEQVDAPLVVLMAPLDRERVRRFAAGNGVGRVDQFVAAIDDADLSFKPAGLERPDPQAALASSMTLARPSVAFQTRKPKCEEQLVGHCHINRFYWSLLAQPRESDSIESMT